MTHPCEYCECPNCITNRLARDAHRLACRKSAREAGFISLAEDQALEAKPNQFITIGHLVRSIMHGIQWRKENPTYRDPPDTHQNLPCMGWWADETERAI